RPAAKTRPDAKAPQPTRMPGTIQPRLTARTKKKTTPRRVTTPPVKASVLAPMRSSTEIVRPQSKPLARGGTDEAARAGAGGGGIGTLVVAEGAGCGGTGAGRGGGGGGAAAAARGGTAGLAARRSATGE